MFHRKDAVALAVCSLLACAGVASAATSEAAPAITLDPSVVSLADAAPQGLLMQGLERIGVGKPLNDLGINIYGHIQGGWLYNPNRSSGESNVGHTFTSNAGNHVLLNQVDLTFERVVDLKKFDVGGKIEVIYGTDGRYIHSYGWSLYDTDNLDSPYAQFDFVQAYVDVAIPVGNGLRVRAGKFVTLMGMETINPTTNAFYSHSMLFNYSIPFTHSGILLTYNWTDQLTTSFGVVRGNDVSPTKDNNGSVSFIGQVGFTPMKNLQAYFNFSVGPENFGDTGHYSQIYNFVATYALTEQWSFGLDITTGFNSLGGGDSANWYGVALYSGYKINDMMTFNARAEWFHDVGDTRFVIDPNTGATLSSLGTAANENYWEITLGLTVTPFPKDNLLKNLKLRPEARYDFAEDSLYSGGSNKRP